MHRNRPTCLCYSGARQVQRSDRVRHHQERMSTSLEAARGRRRIPRHTLRGRASGGRQAVLDNPRHIRQGKLSESPPTEPPVTQSVSSAHIFTYLNLLLCQYVFGLAVRSL